MWDTIAHMDEYCSSSGYNVSSDYLSKGSRNQGDSKQYFNLNMTKNFDIDSGTTKESSFTGCNLHAFCYACVEEDGGVNDYCAAYVEHYNSLDISGWYHFFQEEHNYWCEDDIIGDIDNNQTLPCDTHATSDCEDDSHLRGFRGEAKNHRDSSISS